MTATLRSTTPPELGPGGRRLVIDCRHGTTFVDQFIPHAAVPVVLSERAMIAIAVERHELEEGCGCAKGLDTRARPTRWKGARA
jgi:hypothetical protein